MTKRSRRVHTIIFTVSFCMILVMGQMPNALSAVNFNPLANLGAGGEVERDHGYFTIQDEQGKVVTKTALPVSKGDEFIAANNKHYRVISVQGDIARARFIGTMKLSYNPEWDNPTLTAATGQGKKIKFGVYHTHTDESYVPTDGSSSIYGKGGIYKVGNTYVSNLRKLGIEVEHSMRPHDPHDANAYHRSRRTATQLMKKGAGALIDVHRDAVPPDVYASKVKGKEVTKVKLVVGRRNPHMGANLQFAKDIKSYTDKSKPGLIEGIFIGKGNYNQDLTPKSILIEVGSHTNSREKAQAGVALFSDSIPRVLGASTTAQTKPAPSVSQRGNVKATPQSVNRVTDTAAGSKSSWSSIGWIVGAVVIGGGLFLLISTGSIKGSMDKVRHFGSKEFTNALGIKPKSSPNKPDSLIKKEKKE